MTPAVSLQPPHSPEAEQSLLGALLLDNQAFDRVADLVSAGDFYRDENRRIWCHITRLVEAGRPADVVTVSDSIEASEDKDKTGGAAYLAELAQNTPSALNIRRYAEVVYEKALMRRVLQCGQEMVGAVLAGSRPACDIVEEFEAKMLAVRGDELPEEVDLPTVLMRAADRADEARRTGPRALKTGFRDLDAKLGGLAPGTLTILAARTSVGKTALALNIAEQVSTRHPVVFFSLEMGREELAERLLASSADVPSHALRSGSLNDEQVNELAQCAGELGQRRLEFDDRPAITLGFVRARCRRWKRKHNGLGLVIVDYLQLMSAEGETREQEVASLSRGLKAIAKELRVPVIALCQLNRDVEKRLDKRPQLYDLRESGALEHDADLVLMLYRDDLHVDDSPNCGLCQVLIRKHRNGPVGDVTLRYVPEFCRFETTDRRFQASKPPVPARVGFNADA